MTRKEQQQLNQLRELGIQLAVAKSLCKTAEERGTLDLLCWMVRRKRDQIEEIIANKKIRRRFLARKIGQCIR
jgi:hypothetical protein